MEKNRGTRIRKLPGTVDRDYENSSIPSSQSRNRQKISTIVNALEENPERSWATAHHGRKKREATQTVHLPAPKIVAEDPVQKKTKKVL